MKIKFYPTNQEFENDPSKTLLQQCNEHGIAIKSICKGVPSCAECRVHIKEGEHNLIPPSAKELQVLGSNYFLDGRRLSCQVRAFGNVTVDLTDQIERAENQNKKVRGFRLKKGEATRETQAKQGILMLDEKRK